VQVVFPDVYSGGCSQEMSRGRVFSIYIYIYIYWKLCSLDVFMGATCMFFKFYAGGCVLLTFNLEAVYSVGLFWRWCTSNVYSGGGVIHTFIFWRWCTSHFYSGGDVFHIFILEVMYSTVYSGGDVLHTFILEVMYSIFLFWS